MQCGAFHESYPCVFLFNGLPARSAAETSKSPTKASPAHAWRHAACNSRCHGLWLELTMVWTPEGIRICKYPHVTARKKKRHYQCPCSSSSLEKLLLTCLLLACSNLCRARAHTRGSCAGSSLPWGFLSRRNRLYMRWPFRKLTTPCKVLPLCPFSFRQGYGGELWPSLFLFFPGT